MSAIAKLLKPHIQDLGGFNARRSLPHDELMMVGAFIFFDHLGVANFPPNKGVDVRPHPHINLATVTYLFEGVLLHRDSLGYEQEIHPGAVNWMTAGKGIVHSERSPESDRTIDSNLHAIQTWVALPEEMEEVEPSFIHYPANDIPRWSKNGVKIALVAGEIAGKKSPVKTLSPIIYLDLDFTSGSKFTLPADYTERAIYSVAGTITIDGEAIPEHHLAVLNSGKSVEITATEDVRCVVVGGESVGKRYKWWNFVSSSKTRIEQAQEDWQSGKFDSLPRETEFIPLPKDREVKENII